MRERLESLEASAEIGRQRTNLALGIPPDDLMLPGNINRVVGGAIAPSQLRSRQRSPALDEEFISIYVTLDPVVMQDPKEFDLAIARINRTASGFGAIRATADKRNLQIDMWVKSGRGHTQHLNTLKQDMLAVDGVKDVVIVP